MQKEVMSNFDNKDFIEPLEEDELGLQGFETPRALMNLIDEDLSSLLEITNRPVVSANQFNRTQLIQLCRLAAKYETEPQRLSRPLTGMILISAFYEPSTRTRLSFESAWHRLGGDIMSITDSSTTGIAKGESLQDVGEMLNNYGDMVVLRDSNEDSIYQMLETLRIPVINGGNGTDEHPTQALADIYTILKAYPRLLKGSDITHEDRLKIGVVGVPKVMRTMRSLLIFLNCFSQGIAELVVITEKEKPLSDKQMRDLKEGGIKFRVAKDLDKELPHLDIIYQNSIAWLGDGYTEFGSSYRLTATSRFKKSAVVLHPLARGDELDKSLDKTPFNWYFAQARGAVFVRMALLSAILKVYS